MVKGEVPVALVKDGFVRFAIEMIPGKSVAPEVAEPNVVPRFRRHDPEGLFGEKKVRRGIQHPVLDEDGKPAFIYATPFSNPMENQTSGTFVNVEGVLVELQIHALHLPLQLPGNVLEHFLRWEQDRVETFQKKFQHNFCESKCGVADESKTHLYRLPNEPQQRQGVGAEGGDNVGNDNGEPLERVDIFLSPLPFITLDPPPQVLQHHVEFVGLPWNSPDRLQIWSLGNVSSFRNLISGNYPWLVNGVSVVRMPPGFVLASRSPRGDPRGTLFKNRNVFHRRLPVRLRHVSSSTSWKSCQMKSTHFQSETFGN